MRGRASRRGARRRGSVRGEGTWASPGETWAERDSYGERSDGDKIGEILLMSPGAWEGR